MSTWRKEITAALAHYGETWDDVDACTLTSDQLDEEFDDWLGEGYSVPFTLYTAGRVYFPVVYDLSQWVNAIPRNPGILPPVHIGEGCGYSSHIRSHV